MNIRFFLFLLTFSAIIIVSLFSWNAYGYYQAIHADDPIDPTLYIQSWSGKIIRGDLAIHLATDESYVLQNADTLETGEESIAIVNWPDGSITRLWPDTRIVIEKMNVSSDYSTIQISYAMKRGKVWNNVIRLLIGESYFEAHLPKDNIVAGVRGTTFEINLDNKYIQAVHHSTQLSDNSGKSIELFPGELVDSENIWIQKGREFIDTTWNGWNTLSDAAYEELRAINVKAHLDIFREKTHAYLSLDRLTEKVLSYFPGFESIDITRYLESGDTGSLASFSEQTLLKYYQRISGVALPEYRDTIRGTLLSKINDIDASQELKNLLERANLWESIDAGKILPSAEKFLKDRGISPIEFSAKFANGMRADTRKLLESLSGRLDGVLHF